MPRKPTPSILNETLAEEASSPVVEVEIPVPAAAVKAAETVKEAFAEASAAAEEATDRVEEIVQEAVAEALPADETETPGEPEATVGFKLPIPSPLYKPLHTMLLASLGMVSYAVEESMFVVHKLVERGELTEKEGVKLLNVLAKRARRKAKTDPGAAAEEADAASEAVDEVKTEVVEIAAEDAEAPEEEEEVSNVRPKNVVNLNLFSPGSTVNLTPGKKPKK